MTELSQLSASDRLRAAWLSIEGDDPLARWERISLEASAAGQPDLMETIADLKAPAQAELDLHLDGEVVHNHETDAAPFGKLINRMAVAAKELGKSISGKERLPTTLRVLAPAMGSVRVVFRAPEPVTTQDVVPGDAVPDTLDTLALHRLAAILQHTNEVSGESPLLAEVQGLRVGARGAVQRVAKAVIDGGWDVEGYFRQRGKPQEQVRLTQRGARRLVDAINNTVTEEEPLTLTGVIDGQRRSLGAMWFIPQAGRTFEAVVPGDLMDRVGELAAEPDHVVRAKFTVYVTHPLGEVSTVHRSYSLTDIADAPLGVEFPLQVSDEGSVGESPAAALPN